MIQSSPGATLSNSAKDGVASAAKVDCGGRDTDDTLVVSAIPLNWTAAAYKTHFPDCRDVRCFEPMFSDGYNTSKYTRKNVRSDKEIGGWNRRWSSLRIWHPGYVDPRDILDMLSLRHTDERCSMRRLLVLVRRFDEGVFFDALDLCYWDRPFDGFYLV